MKKNKPMTFVDLFCGCGGLSYGFERAGHECLLGVDSDARALESFAHNHPHSKTFLGDIRTLNSQKLSELIENKTVDMIVGGPPCQGFSTVGAGNADDDRNMLFKEFVRVVKVLKPNVVLFENVTGIVASKNQFVLKSIFKEFTKMGFTMQARILSAEEYGVAEKRRRAIIIGVKNGEFNFPEITHGSRGTFKTMTVKEVWRNLKSSSGEIFNHSKMAASKMKDIDLKRLSFIPSGCGIRYEKDEKKYLPKKLWWGLNWNSLREKRFRQTRLQRLSWNKPSPTILTSRTSYYHPKENRYLTCREAAACQSFPNDFLFFGTETSIFRQIGNAVPPLLAEKLGMAIKKIKWNQKLKKEQTKFDFKKNAFDYKESTYVA
jgi:DNA (cytosine-5)-methyltransferase 1